MVEICAGCDCNSNPELIKPYLERGVVLPILTLPYNYYNPHLLDVIVKYPHIGFHSFWTYRFVKSTSEESKNAHVYCPHCFDEDCDKLLADISKMHMDKSRKSKIMNLLENVVFAQLNPPRDQELRIFNQIKDAVKQKKFQLIYNLGYEANLLNGLRVANNFSAVPQVDQHDMEQTIKISEDLNISLPENVTDEIQNKEWAVKALDLVYNPKMPIEEYLDVILPRKRKINVLLSEMISKGSENKQLNDELWKINQEVCSSKSLETITCLTNFISNNSSILFGMLTGALIGYFSGDFLSCGLGSMGGLASGFAAKVASKYKSFKVPRYPKKTMEWIKSKIEGPEYKILSLMLSKDTKIIQAWALQEKIKGK